MPKLCFSSKSVATLRRGIESIKTPPPKSALLTALPRNDASHAPSEKKLRLTTKERDLANAALTAFGETVRRAERKHIASRNRPKSSFFPSFIVTSILDKLLSLNSLAALTNVVTSWFCAAGTLLRFMSSSQNYKLRSTPSARLPDSQRMPSSEQLGEPKRAFAARNPRKKTTKKVMNTRVAIWRGTNIRDRHPFLRPQNAPRPSRCWQR
ncbi:hypothetical protein B0H17DRAFT_1144475 [Mycena rosella]|uniref:Uncharacterized protein n=1 Tax=Mycena rosella TaxID=1033263 RepID=A0AAD7CTC4_MYCRO|nr:hypothetical protein B0H17DRAFT_1144475 [Mycena rosella]